MISLAVLTTAIVAAITASVLIALRSRNQSPESKDQFNWSMPLYAAVFSCLIFLPLMLSDSWDMDFFLYLLIAVPVVSVVLLLTVAIRKRQRLSTFLVLLAYLAATGTLFRSSPDLRPPLRWLLWSRRYKAEVMAQVPPANGELRHIEWDGWGGVPVGDWTAYVVFDPIDSLSMPAKSHLPGKFSGIPCDADRVRRLERNWYSVEFSMNEWWDQCERNH